MDGFLFKTAHFESVSCLFSNMVSFSYVPVMKHIAKKLIEMRNEKKKENIMFVAVGRYKVGGCLKAIFSEKFMKLHVFKANSCCSVFCCLGFQ